MNTSLQLPVKLKVDRQRLLSYLLNLSHPGGGSKAKFFLGWGFSPSDLDTFETALKSHFDPSQIANAQHTPWDIRIQCLGPMATPNGFAPKVLTAWGIDHGTAEWRLFTAHPY
ncbi:DUF6883 domain-containing protein [Lichenibacterium ramalinae]|uniref:DUF6883 domain-containing protein n=1 Tax=Lichenibacterium ramalinae TaxID=2316527 RepID=UPI0013EC61FB|nr:DUF6883 domain-containing protein [Lichenibacterium ramalinae]